MLSKNHPIILFIDRFGFSLYQDTLANIPKFNFTPDLVANSDVVNKEQFVSLIATFIQINKIVGSSLVVILSDNVIYIKDLKIDSNDDKDHKDEVQDFLENIPFEEVLAKVIKVGNANRIVATNKDIVMIIANAFTDKGSTLEAIAPGFMYGQNANFTMGLTPDNALVILGDAEALRSGNLLTNQEKMIPSQNLESELKNLSADTKPDLASVKKPQSLRQYILVGVLVTLLVILAVVYLNLGVSQTPPQNPKIKSASVTVNEVNVIPTVIPTSIQESITTAPIDFKTISVRISHSAQFLEAAANLKSGLTRIGFENIVDEVSEASTPEKSSVIFSPSIPADLRNNVIAEIKKILPDISILENQESSPKINILIGKS